MPTEKRDGREEFLKVHLKGARFFSIDDASDKSTNLPHMLPSVEFMNNYLCINNCYSLYL